MNDLKCREFEVRDVAAAGAGLLIGAGIGAGLMYLFDPDRGRTRRARLESQAGGLYRTAQAKAVSVGKDLTHRAEGLAAEAKRVFEPHFIEPEILTARVRAQLGRLIRRPHEVSVAADATGLVTLTGFAESEDVRKLLDGIMKVPGVHDVRNELKFHTGAVPGVGALQHAG